VLALDGETRESWLFLAENLPGQLRASDSLAAQLMLSHVAPASRLTPYLERRLSQAPRLTFLTDAGGLNAQMLGRVTSPVDSLPLENPFELWRSALQRRWGDERVFSDTSVIIQVRQIKSEGEIRALRQAGEASAAALRAGFSAITAGRRQRAVEGLIVAACLSAGAIGPSFWPWAMSGLNTQPARRFGDYRNLDRTMRAGDLIGLDVGCEVDHYMGDLGRTVPVSGQFDAGQREAWELLVRSYRAGLAVIRDGARQADVRSASYGEVQRLQDSLQTPFARHAAGVILSPEGARTWPLYGIGLSFHEDLPETLRAGMVLVYEPLLSVDGQRFYLHDMILVTVEGYQILTPNLPYTALEIERAMARRP
jgi:Xaa-Pro aminopeptidase